VTEPVVPPSGADSTPKFEERSLRAILLSSSAFPSPVEVADVPTQPPTG
jgi:hypothetical protein